MFSANRWCVFATADALLVPRDERGSPSGVPGELPDGVCRTPRFDLPKTRWEAAFNQGDPRRPEMFIFEFDLDTQRDGEPVQVPAPAPPIDGPTAMHN